MLHVLTPRLRMSGGILRTGIGAADEVISRAFVLIANARLAPFSHAVMYSNPALSPTLVRSPPIALKCASSACPVTLRNAVSNDVPGLIVMNHLAAAGRLATPRSSMPYSFIGIGSEPESAQGLWLVQHPQQRQARHLMQHPVAAPEENLSYLALCQPSPLNAIVARYRWRHRFTTTCATLEESGSCTSEKTAE